MAEKETYELKGTLRKDCMRDIALLEDFHALESDWRELFRWLMSVSGDIPYFDRGDRESGRLSSLWENHVLTVLVDILQKDICGYVDAFVEGRSTSAQEEYTGRLQVKFREWVQRLETFLRQSCSTLVSSPSVEVAKLLLNRLETALPREQTPHRRFVRFSGDMNRPYFQMLGAVQDIQQHAATYIARIESGGDLDASLALLLTFIRNYCGIADRFNRRFEGWAGFYRKNILNDTPKEAVQDSTFFIVEPDRKKMAETFPLPAGTGFIAGKKADGTDLVYATLEKEYIVPAHIHAACSLFLEDGQLHTVSVVNGETQNLWPLFSTGNPAAAPLEYGWLLFSRSLVLSEGRRKVRVCFDFKLKDNMPDLSPLAGDTVSFRLQTGGSKGWTSRKYALSYERESYSLQFCFTLEESEEAPVVCTEEVHGIATGYPAVRILIADRERTDILRGLEVGNIRIQTEVEGIRNFTLIGDSGQSDPSLPFYPFGPLGERDSRFIFGHEEAALKEITAISLNGVWSKLPEGGFGPIYRNYNVEKPIDDSSFTVRCEWQDGNGWHEFGDSPRPLFSKEGADGISGKAVFVFEYSRNLPAGNFMPYRHDSRGFYRMVLATPGIGFGMNAYYTLFSEIMVYNSREKEKNRRSLPEKPQVPMLADMTFGYRSEEMLGWENGGMYRLTGMSGYEECRDIGGQSPVFLPDVDAPALMVGLEGMGGTKRVRLYFSLRYAVSGGMPVAEQSACVLHISRYAGGGFWHEFRPEEILCEETEGFTRSGFIELKVQEETEGSGLWLRFSFTEGKKPEGMVLDGIFLNCIRVQAVGGDGASLAVGTALVPVLQDSRILSVFQLQPGSGGRPAETEAAAGIRQRIRITTRNRAVCGSDYEQLLLDRFPEVEKVCCVPADDERHGVRLVVFPKPEAKRYPFLPGWKLAEMEKQVRRCTSPFAGVKVVNPVYEPLCVRFKAMLKKDTRDPGEVKRRTERRIRIFFMAWYMNGALPDLGVKYSYKALLSRIGNDKCMEKVEYLKIDRNDGEGQPGCDGDILYESTDRCGILYVKDITVELEEYRSGVESAKIGTDFIIG